MSRPAFSFDDIAAECTVTTGCYRLDGRLLGLRIAVPEALHGCHPFNASAYDFLQQLRKEIFEWGIIEFPGLPLNPTNYTLAQRAPQQHAYSSNPYLTDFCQSPHQDTPPYPTAFWLAAPRRYFATWVMGHTMAERFYQLQGQQPQLSVDALHEQWVARSLEEGSGLLLNRQPGLLILDNSHHNRLYHARTSLLSAQQAADVYSDTPMYAFNEVGLLHYIDQMDSRRGDEHRDAQARQRVAEFMAREGLQG